MAVVNKFSITYGGLKVGGDSQTYQLLGPYSIDRNYERMRLTFDALVVADSYANLRALSQSLENTYSERNGSFTITIDGNSWVYTSGSNVLNVVSAIAKTANPETDKGFSRAYTIAIEATMVEVQYNGLRTVSSVVAKDASGIATVTINGVYTAEEGYTASQNYVTKADSACSTLLSLRLPGKTTELIEETYTPDQNNHLCSFTRVYKELVFNQSGANLNDPRIADHKITMADMWQQPGDSQESVYRLRRVDATFDCAVLAAGGNPYDLWESVVRGYMIDVFNNTFSPQQFAIEEARSTYDQTGQRLMATMRFVFQPSEGANVIELNQNLTYRENRTVDYTPIHSGRETDMYVDVGFTNIERIWIRSVVVVGDEFPRKRTFQEQDGGGATASEAGDFTGPIGGVSRQETAELRREGWNLVSSQSQVTEQWLGHPDHGRQFKISTLNETIMERYNTAPAAGTTPGGRQ